LCPVINYFLGQREVGYAAANLPLPPQSETLLRDLLFWIFAWFSNTITSAVAGVAGSFFSRFRRPRWEIAGSDDDFQYETMPEVLEYSKSDTGGRKQVLGQEDDILILDQEKSQASNNAKSRPKKRWLWLSMAGISALVLWLVVIIMTKAIDVQNIFLAIQPVGSFITITPQPHPLAEDRTLGDPKAPVVVEIFDDFQCSICAVFTEKTEHSLANSTYIANRQVYYVFRHYPFLDDQQDTKESDQAAYASMCAMEQGRFWDYHDMLYANQNGVNQGAFRDKRLLAFADALSLDMEAFRECFDENRYQDEIERDVEMALQYDAYGVPSVFVNGEPLMPGYVPSYDALVRAIETALANRR